jgi:predicted transcriptional regulator
MKRAKKLSSQISIRLEDEIKAALEEMAAADDRSLSSLINRVLRQYVEAARGKKPKAKS